MYCLEVDTERKEQVSVKNKEKLVLAVIFITAATLVNLYFTAALHGLLSRQRSSLAMVPLFQCIKGLFTERRQLLLFLSFEGFLVLCSILFWVQNNRPYQSDLVRVADDIYTPAPTGQYQHGSSRWLKPEEWGHVFRTQTIDPQHPVIRMLLETGYDHLPFLEKDSPAKGTPGSGGQMAVNKNQGEDSPDPCKLFDTGGIVVGMEKEGNREKLYLVGDDTHTLTIGATRSGKTRCLVIQSICSTALAGESLVISDPKAELFHYTADYLKKLNYEVVCLDFKNPEKSTRYNLLQPVIDAVNKGDLERAEMYAWDITNILVGDNVSNEKIWENGEKSTIAAGILCVVVDNKKRPEYQNLTNVYWFIAEMSRPVNGKTPMSEYMASLPHGHPARALMSIAEVAPSRTRGSFDTSALTTLRLFTSRSIYAITHTSDYNIADIGNRKQALFLVLPDEKTTYYPIASLMVSQLYDLLVHQSDLRGGRLANRVNFILDEFGNFTRLNDFTNKLTVAGGRGIRFNLFLQSFEQLTQKYDRETAAIVKSNCQTWVYLQADDKETLQDVCDKLGKYTTSAYQLSSQHGRYVNPSSSHSISLVGRELLTADEIRRICRPYQIVTSRAHPAMMHAPDLSQWYFNRMCGLGDPEHNRKVREARENARPVLPAQAGEIPLWNIWLYYRKALLLKEAQQKTQAGTIFPSVKSYQRTGGSDQNEE